MSQQFNCSLVIPVYKSEKILLKLNSEILKTMTSFGEEFSYEVIFVSDASPDNSFEVIKNICQNNNFKGISLRNNIGQHGATIVGMRFAKGRYVITMDDDLQHLPKHIPELLKKIESGYDVVYCNFNSKKHPIWKILGSYIVNYIMVKTLKKPKDLYLSSYRAITNEVCREIIISQNNNSYIDGTILKITNNIASIKGDHSKRLSGKSNYNLKKSTSLFLKMITGFTVFPLRMVSLLGVIIFLFSLLLTILLFVRHFIYHDFPVGWPSLIVTIMFLGGLQLVAIGVLGEYLAKIFSFTDSKSIYSINDKINL
jgi:glycosyltransferase involved in cell wall biosynthesis